MHHLTSEHFQGVYTPVDDEQIISIARDPVRLEHKIPAECFERERLDVLSLVVEDEDVLMVAVGDK